MRVERRLNDFLQFREEKEDIGVIFFNFESTNRKVKWFAPLPWPHISAVFFFKQQNVGKTPVSSEMIFKTTSKVHLETQ